MSGRAELPEELLPSQIHGDCGDSTEEILNSITHAIGAGLAIAGLVALVILTGRDPSPWKYLAFSIFGASQILLFLSSALTHGFTARPRIRRRFSVLDFTFIYVLIAGIYTPVCLIAMRGSWGWAMLGVVWGLATIGIVLRAVFFDKTRQLGNLLYIPMALSILPVWRPMLQSTSIQFATLIAIGGAWYALGLIFYLWRRLPFSHVIWHLFIIGGSASFFAAFVLHLV